MKSDCCAALNNAPVLDIWREPDVYWCDMWWLKPSTHWRQRWIQHGRLCWQSTSWRVALVWYTLATKSRGRSTFGRQSRPYRRQKSTVLATTSTELVTMSTATCCRIQVVADLSPKLATKSTVCRRQSTLSPICRRFRQQSTFSPVCTGLREAWSPRSAWIRC